MKKLLVINVLGQDSYDDCHIAGSISVPRDELEEFIRSFDREHTDIVVYCAHSNCPLSRQAWYIAHDMGFKNVKAYEGGIREWFQKKFPTRGMCKLAYLKEPLVPAEKEDRAVDAISAEELRAKMKVHELL